MPATVNRKPPKLKLRYVAAIFSNVFVALTKAAQQCPEILVTGIPGKRVFVINHPDIARHILQKNYANYPKASDYKVLALLLGKGLVTNEGHDWHQQRTLIQPAFHRQTLKRICDITVSATAHLLQRWKAKEGSEINFTREMAEVTIDIVAKSLFTTDITAAHIQTIWNNVNYLNAAADSMMINPFALPFSFPTPRHSKMKKYIAELDGIVYGIINRRKQEKNPPPDLLQLLLEARYADTGEGMTDLQIRDEVMTIFLAGHETTVNALSWTWYLLKKHSTEAQLLQEESIKFAGHRNPAFEDVPQMIYGKYVMSESMRMFPPVPAIARKPLQAEDINGYHIPAGVDIVINTAGIHHHPAYWQEPFAFKPQRFETMDAQKGDNRFVYMPFGGGPRICIGNNFAMLEMQLINAMLSARVDMELLSHDVNPKALITLKPENGVRMRIRRVEVI